MVHGASIPNSDSGIGEDGHSKDHPDQVAQGWQTAPLRTARRAHCIPVKGVGKLAAGTAQRIGPQNEEPHP
jgi:hypothetical protein